MTKRADAIAIAELYCAEYKHGPCIHCNQIGTTASDYWEVEFAHEGQMGRCETTDPSSILLRVNVRTNEVQCLEPM